MTATSSQPSSPQPSRICLVACTSSGTVAYSHLDIAEPYSRTLRRCLRRPALLRLIVGVLLGAIRLGGMAGRVVVGADLALLSGRQLGNLRNFRYIQGNLRGGPQRQVRGGVERRRAVSVAELRVAAFARRVR